jgi:Protein of unknown function (DUF3352)
MRVRLFPPVLAVAALAVAVAGCGGGGGSSPADLAAFAPPESVLYLQVEIQPKEPTKGNVDSIAKRVGGIGNLGDYIVSKLEKSAQENGESVDFAKEVEPWLGERAAAIFTAQGLNHEEGSFVVESTDPQAAQKFIDSHTRESSHPYRDAEYKGVSFKVGGKDANAVGVVDGSIVESDNEAEFQQVVDATTEESLADEERFKNAFEGAVEGSFADLYLDIGSLVRRDREDFDAETVSILKTLGVDLGEATAVASVVPGPDQLEIDVSSDLTGGGSASPESAKLLGSLPAASFGALAIPDFGGALRGFIDRLDEAGIPGQLPPHQLKKALESQGIDLGEIASSIKNAGVFAVGRGRPSLGGALVMTTESPTRAENTVSNIGLLLRLTGAAGVTQLKGRATGFAVHSASLGGKPIVIAAEGNRMAIGYGVPQTLVGLSAATGSTLSENPDYTAAVASLGETPISGFADGSAALRLAESLVPASDSGFREARRYLRSIRFIAAGFGSEGGRGTAKLIVGLNK